MKPLSTSSLFLRVLWSAWTTETRITTTTKKDSSIIFRTNEAQKENTPACQEHAAQESAR